MAELFTFLMEKSRTPIYQRIVESFQNALVQRGHRVLLVDPNQFDDYQDYLIYIQNQLVDYCLISNPRGLISQYVEERSAFVFELTDARLIFVHHDNCFSGLHSFDKIYQTIQALHQVKQRSVHFCLEYHNFLDLRQIGIEQVYSLPHASEFAKAARSEDWAYDVTFVGHVLPHLGSELEDIPCSHHLRADFWNRLVHLDYRMERSAIAFAENFPLKTKTDIEFLAAKSFYISMLHIHSQFFRGEVIRRIDAGNVDIIGGDPAYLHGIDQNQQIKKANIRYHPSTTDYSSTQRIYAQSKINLNVTSLQFDQAVINRVIDVAAVGGFILTDHKPGLDKLTSVANEISYRTLEELNHKIAYYLHPEHERERLEIAEALHQDIQKNCTYTTVVDLILSKLVAMPTDNVEPVRIDLGCGPWKAAGHIGVDIAPAPGVDVVADLSQRFPFADSSVDVIRAYDVIEHLEDRIHTMNEMWRICKPEGLVDIRVPSTDGRGAFQDPTHISFWNINSFKYYCIEFPNYLKLCHIYGFQGVFRLESLSEETSEDQVVHVRARLRAIKQSVETERLAETLKLRTINLLACPDWQQPEEQLFSDLLSLLRTLVTHPDRHQMTLLVDPNPINSEEADAAITTVLMHLLTDEGIEIDDTGPEITLLDNLDLQVWQSLIPCLSAQIIFENQIQTTELNLIETLPTMKITEFTRIK